MVETHAIDLSFKANWKNIKERKMAQVEELNQHKNAKRISHPHSI
jgi:hypothetical protein